jgi:threonylcarbamoyladenosine tRNA methylthiotransferase MtaB
MKIYVKTFGCRVNQVETESLIERIREGGHELIDNFETAGAVLINTCSVTGEADKDCARFLRVISRRNPDCRIIVTGCYATVNPERVLQNAPGAVIVGNKDKQNIPALLFGLKETQGFGWRAKEHLGHSRAFVKIQDGCNCRCKYCIVPTARPDLSSKSVAETLDEAAVLAANGYAEIVLSGINIGNYKCPDTGKDLAGLLDSLWTLKGDFRIRFSSIEVRNINDALLESALRGGERFCDYFHVPLQAGSDKVLCEMGRNYDLSLYSAAASRLRKAWPGLGLYADIIAGYPAETHEDFEAALKFVEETKFAGLHVFSYSPRQGTPAAQMPQLAREEIKTRSQTLRALDKKLRAEFAQSLVGTVQRVALEKEGDGRPHGLTGNFVNVDIEGNIPSAPIFAARIKEAKSGRCIAGQI